MSKQTDRFWRRALAEIDDGGFFDNLVAHPPLVSGLTASPGHTVTAPEHLLAEEMIQSASLSATDYPGYADTELLDCMALLDGGWLPPLTPETRPVVILSLLLMFILFLVEAAILLSIGV